MENRQQTRSKWGTLSAQDFLPDQVISLLHMSRFLCTNCCCLLCPRVQKCERDGRGICFCHTPKGSYYIGEIGPSSQVRQAAEGDERDLVRESDMSEGSSLHVETLAAGNLEHVLPVIRVRHEH